MKPRHTAQSWLLLLIIVSMQLVNAFHIHEPHFVASVECDMCAHHIHHSGHLTGDQYHMHPCLSCQLSSNEYIEPQTTVLASAQQRVVELDCCPIQMLPVTTSTIWQSRAPPAI